MAGLETKIEINDQFKTALNLLEETSGNVFITGRAGTGKSTLLNYFKSVTKKKVVVLAPTGVAALNVQGQTIHSFFGFRPNIVLGKVRKLRGGESSAKLYKNIDTIVIDEVSMVRADLLDCVEKFLRLNGRRQGQPFGGTQMIFVGDLYQLPPVVTAQDREALESAYSSPFFFSAESLGRIAMDFMELETVYRQKDERFLGILNAIRDNSVTDDELDIINSRLIRGSWAPGSKVHVYLTTTNKVAESINDRELQALEAEAHAFPGTIDGKFEDKYLPTSKRLELKLGSQVMFLNNDPASRWVNGTIGRVASIEKDRDVCREFNEDNPPPAIVTVELEDGRRAKVVPHTWDIFRYSFDENKGGLSNELVGSFTQFPLKLAWAVTIHKSQGKTFDEVTIDIGYGAFAHGQLYVALSRCTTLEGVSLKRPVARRDILMDERVVAFLKESRGRVALPFG